MFWKLGFHNPKAPLAALLERDDVKLEEVLDQDDFLQEAKAGNDRLIAFLTQPDCIRKLLQFTTETACGEDVDEKRRFKFPYLACELLVADIPSMESAVVETAEHMKLLFNFLLQPSPLPQSLSLYFVRVLQTLYTKKPLEVTTYFLQQDGTFAQNFIRHIETFGMNELILTLLGAMDEENRFQNGCTMAEWWMNHNFTADLFDRLTAKHSADVHINIIRMLCELVRRFNNPNVAHLADSLMAPAAARRLMALMLEDLALDCRSIIFTEGTNLVISIIDSLVRKEDACRQMREKLQQLDCTMSSCQELSMEVEAAVNLTFQAFLERVPELVEFLKAPGPLEELDMTWAKLKPPLGLARLKTVELLLVMLKTKRRFIEDAMVKLDLVNICLDLFFQYDMNNLLHILVDEIVTSCIVSNNETLIISLFQDCKLLERILRAVKDDMDRRASRPQSIRKGYFGHIASISNKIAQFEDQQLLIRRFTQPCEAWGDYVHTILAARNSAENTSLGGASPQGLRAGDVLDGEVPCVLPPRNAGFGELARTEEVEDLAEAVPVPQKYALSSKTGNTLDMWTLPDDAESSGAQPKRDADFDARGVIFDDDKPGASKQHVEEVWQERQIVDHSEDSAGDADWGRFDEPVYPPPPVSAVKPGLVFYDLEEDSSSSDEEPPQAPVRKSQGPPTSPPITQPATESPPVTHSAALTDCSGCQLPASANVPAFHAQGERQPEEAQYSDFNFWKPNWGDVCMPAD